MAHKIFMNLPVKDLKRSMAFYESLGWKHNPQFTDDTAASIVVSEDIYVMLLTHEKFSQFTRKQIADSSKTAQMLICLSADSKDDVHRIVDAAVKSGATEPGPLTDYGFMMFRTFEDPDGHTWEVLFMDPSHIQK
ncbi:MAG: VOC family protein [Rhodospirillaceae bacterium]